MSEAKKVNSTEDLRQLREQRKASIEHAREIIKTRNRDIKKIKSYLQSGAKTVPEIATAVQMPSAQVLVYISGLRKYGLIFEGEKMEDYFTYGLAG